MIKQDILEGHHNTIILALGSNLGNRADNIEKTNVDLPPKHFDCDISTNVAMILAKNNNTSPIKISEILITLFKKDFS